MRFVEEVNRFGAMLEEEAADLFGQAVITGAVEQRICELRSTAVGQAVVLLFAGRRLAGLAGAFTPTDAAIANMLCLRDIGLRLEAAGFEIDLESRKRSLVYVKSKGRTKKSVLVLAQEKGYALEVLRRMYWQLVAEGEYDQIQLFTYLNEKKLEELRKYLHTPPGRSHPISPDEVAIFSLLGTSRGQLPEGVI